MSGPTIEYFWMLVVGTIGMLALVTAIIFSVVMANRRVVRTQRDKMEALQQSEKKYRHLVESMEDSVFLIDKKGIIKLVNERYAKFFGYKPVDMMGKTLAELFNSNRIKSLLEGIEHVINTEKIEKVEWDIEIRDNYYWFETILIPQHANNDISFSILGISRDTTDRRKMEDKLKELVSTLNSQQETLKLLSSEVIRAQEAERKRISRELHDEIGHNSS